MQVKLKVLGGSHAGKEIKIPLAKFFIGRGEDCHLRPQSDLISRHHCAILIESGQVIIRDLKSRNGTVVNGEKITGDVQLKGGDTVKVGPLEFEVLIDHSLGGAKKPKVTDVKEAAARATQAASKSSASIDEDIGSWLEEADEEERTKRISSPEARQFRLDLAEAQKAAEADETEVVPTHDTTKTQPAAKDTKAEEGKKSPPKKKEPGKLPRINPEMAKSSKEAAAEMLKKFFNRR